MQIIIMMDLSICEYIAFLYSLLAQHLFRKRMGIFQNTAQLGCNL